MDILFFNFIIDFFLFVINRRREGKQKKNKIIFVEKKS